MKQFCSYPRARLGSKGSENVPAVKIFRGFLFCIKLKQCNTVILVACRIINNKCISKAEIIVNEGAVMEQHQTVNSNTLRCFCNKMVIVKILIYFVETHLACNLFIYTSLTKPVNFFSEFNIFGPVLFLFTFFVVHIFFK